MGGRKQKGSSGSSEKRWRKGLEQEGRKERAMRGNLQKRLCSPQMEGSAKEELFSTGKIISKPGPSLPGLCATPQDVAWLQECTLEKEEAAGMLLWCLIYSCTLGLVFITMNYA